MYSQLADYEIEKSCAERGEVGASGESRNPSLPELGGSLSSDAQEQSRLGEEQQPGTSNSSEEVDRTSQDNDVDKGQRLQQDEQMEETIPSKAPLRALTTLKWPYIPEPPSYPDPLSRDDPKPLSLAQYEGIGTSFILVYLSCLLRFLYDGFSMNRQISDLVPVIFLLPNTTMVDQQHHRTSAKRFPKIQTYPGSFELWIPSAARNEKRPYNAFLVSLVRHRA